MNETVKRKPWSVRHPIAALLLAAVLAFAGAGIYMAVSGPLGHATNYVVTHAQTP